MADKRMYIYKITCVFNGKIYIGRTVKSIKKRLNEHFYESRYVKNNRPLYLDMKKYGKSGFIIELILEFYSKNKNYADAKEREYIDEYDSWHPKGYNVTRIRQ